MAKSPLDQALSNWTTRSRQAAAIGVPSAAWKTLASHDIQNVIHGGSPMPSQEVNVALQSQATHAPVIGEPKARTGLAHIPGNVAADVGGLVTGFIPGALQYLHHLPSETTATVKAFTQPGYAAAHGYEPSSFSPSGLAAATRNVAKLPLLQPLPIVHTAAALTTHQGREQLQQHPVGTVLDLLPAIQDAAGVAGGLARGTAAADSSAMSALAEGKLGKAGVRATVDTLGRITGRTPRATAARWAEGLGVTADIREHIMRPYAVITRQAQRDALKFWHSEIEPTMGKLTDADRQTLWHEAANFDAASNSVRDPITNTLTPIPADHLAILDKVKEMNDRFLEEGINRGKLFEIPVFGSKGKTAVYNADEPVVKLFKGRQQAAGRVQSAMQKLANESDTLSTRQANLAGKVGKVRRFMEREEDFNARPEGPMGFDTVKESVQPFIETFRHLDPRLVYHEILQKIASGEVRKQVSTRLGKDIAELEGETGHVAKFEDALNNRDLRAAQKAATDIARVFRHKAWDGFGTGQRLRSFMGDIRDELIGLGGKETTHGYAARLVKTAERNVATAEEKLAKNKSLLTSRHTAFMEQMVKSPPAAMHPYITQLVREGAVEKARQLYAGQGLEDAIKTLRTTPSTSAMQTLIGKDEFNAIMKSSVESWMDLVREGLDPIWTHYVAPGKYESFMYDAPLKDRFLAPSQMEKRIFNFAPHMQDIAAAVTSAGVELIRESATRDFIENWVMKFARNTQELHAEYMKMIESGTRRIGTAAGEDLSGRALRLMNKEYEAFDPEQFGVKPGGRVTNAQALMVPKGVAKSLRMMTKDFKLPLGAAYNKTMRVYMMSVLTGPRHLVHVGIGGMTMAMLREPGTMLKLVEAARMIRTHEAPIELSHNLYDLPTDGIFHFSVGKTLARHYAEAIGHGVAAIPQALGRFETWMATVERTATMLSAEARGLEREAAMRQALKVYIDMDGMSALERTVIRNVFPFYAFTKHVMRYMFTYPVDHPIRAAFLARFAKMEQDDWDTGLPRKYQQLFFLGQPDAKGNVQTIEYKSINPFRSIANEFTLAGFISGLNPLLTAGFTAAGVNSLTATPELYPATTYDPVSGGIVAKRSDVIPKIVSSFVPEFGAIDHFYQLTDSMKQLKAKAPDAYRRQLFQSLNLPFYPSKVNVPYEQEKTEIHRFQAAQVAGSQALATGHYGPASSFNLVPFQGQLITPEQLQAIGEGAQERGAARTGIPNISAKAVIPKITIRTTPRTRSTTSKNPGK